MENIEDTGLGSKKRKCQVKKGFFVLKACGKEAIGKCTISKIPVCQECSRKDEQGNLISIDEYVKLEKQRRMTSGTSQVDTWQNNHYRDDALWYYMMRDDFYHNQGYQPFTDFDNSGFSNTSSEFGGGDFGGGGAEASFGDDEGSAGFYDS